MPLRAAIALMVPGGPRGPGLPFYTMSQLCERYGGCAKSTIYRKMREQGFPTPERFGKENLFSARAVHDWEKVHMPHLHPGEASDFEVRAADEKRWESFRQERTARLAAATTRRRKTSGSAASPPRKHR